MTFDTHLSIKHFTTDENEAKILTGSEQKAEDWNELDVRLFIIITVRHYSEDFHKVKIGTERLKALVDPHNLRRW
jgi:hypothetical protein